MYKDLFRFSGEVQDGLVLQFHKVILFVFTAPYLPYTCDPKKNLAKDSTLFNKTQKLY